MQDRHVMNIVRSKDGIQNMFRLMATAREGYLTLMPWTCLNKHQCEQLCAKFLDASGLSEALGAWDSDFDEQSSTD